jgi:hypothetical protein
MKCARANCVSSPRDRQSRRSKWKNRPLEDRHPRAKRTLHWARNSIGNRSRRRHCQFGRVEKRPLRGPRAVGRLASGMNEDLRALVAKISACLAIKPEIFIMHPAELCLLRSMTDAHLREFAAEHGWRVVRRVGGRQIEFYNDAGARERLA